MKKRSGHGERLLWSTMNRLSNEQVIAYNGRREKFDSSRKINTISPCIAPYNNMYFTSEGQVAPCWLLVGQFDQWNSTRSMKDIWFGEKFAEYRENLSNSIFNSKCGVCKQKIETENWPLALAYDGFTVREYPTLLELELSNQCNLECIMCEGRLSSGIRKNREKLPPLVSPYDDSFVEQLKEFIPHLEELRFNGGEPFAQKIVYDICMIVAEMKPDLRINLATNGTVYNKQVQTILDKCNVHLNISIDSLDKKTYEAVRINGNFDVLMKNFAIFKEYCHTNNRGLSVMVNPMRNNWKEMPNFLTFCNEHSVYLWYNTIHHPAHLAIWNLSKLELRIIYQSLTDTFAKIPTDNKMGNWEKLNHFINNQVKSWYLK